ncbi:MAG: alpha-amylase family glycosyl hydrolase, partial [Bacteroidales bacterium]|nr:alpha-amylase family glycosyl hydrolase [Bacteroidales bacterium]
MASHHRRIPVLPKRPVSTYITGHITRSYPVGKANLSRSYKGRKITLTISNEQPFPENIMANIITTMNSKEGNEWEKFPFERIDDRTLVCKITPKYAGLHTFRAEFSLDKGKSWFRDTVSDAWLLVDPKQVDCLRLYTLIPNISGTIADWKADLPRIKRMGFNAIHLLPITKQDTSVSPYSANDLFKIDPAYLDPDSKLDEWEQLEEFIEEARKLQIKLCFDLVLNHVGVDSVISKNAPDWIVPDEDHGNGLKRAGYWCDEGWLFWEDLVLLNYEHPSRAIRAEIWSYMMDYALFWTKYANLTDGFVRFDNLHSSNPDFVEALTKKLHEKYQNIGII